ncbi:MAG: hypothetical protein ABI193_23470, partial [Minicystis sp.]
MSPAALGTSATAEATPAVVTQLPPEARTASSPSPFWISGTGIGGGNMTFPALRYNSSFSGLVWQLTLAPGLRFNDRFGLGLWLNFSPMLGTGGGVAPFGWGGLLAVVRPSASVRLDAAAGYGGGGARGAFGGIGPAGMLGVAFPVF